MSAVTAFEPSVRVQTRLWLKLSTMTSSWKNIFRSPSLTFSRMKGEPGSSSRRTAESRIC